VVLRLVRNGVPQYATGSIPILVLDPAQAADPARDYFFKKNGIKLVFVVDGAVVTQTCGWTAVPGHLEANVGELTDLIFFRFIDDPCDDNAASNSLYSLVFQFADPQIAKIVNHPIHWDEKTFFHIEGTAAGSTTLRVWVLSGTTLQFASPPLPVVVNAS
jgi:hypothetical protein